MSDNIKIISLVGQPDGRFTINYKKDGLLYCQKNAAFCDMGNVEHFDGDRYISIFFEIVEVNNNLAIGKKLES